MSDDELGDALVIVHPMLGPVPERHIAELLAPAIWRMNARSALYSRASLRLSGLPAADWRELLHNLGPDTGRLLEMFSPHTGPAIYFGTAPMPVALELGRRLGPTHRVLAYYSGPGGRVRGQVMSPDGAAEPDGSTPR